MKTIGLLILTASISATAFSGSRKAICISGGSSMQGEPIASVSYVHPVLVNQLYLSAGVSYFGISNQPGGAVPAGGEPYPIPSFSFTSLRQLNLGVRFGDHLFVAPKISYNWYGGWGSTGWGIAVGFLVHPMEIFSFGFYGAFDQPRIARDDQPPWAPDVTSVSAIVQLVVGD